MKKNASILLFTFALGFTGFSGFASAQEFGPCARPVDASDCLGPRSVQPNDYPVWQPYQIPDIGPYFRLLPISSYGWAPLQNLRGLGGLFVINRGDKDDRYVVYDAKSTESGWIYYSWKYDTTAGYVNFNQLNFNSFDADKMNEFKYSFWRAEKGTSGDGYIKIRNYASPYNYVYYSYSFIPACDAGSMVYYQWTPRQSEALSFRAEQQSDGRLAFLEDNGHTPYYNNGLMCANGRSIYEPNKHWVDRVAAEGADAARPYRYYPLDSTNRACDYKQKAECGQAGNVSYTTDRFGRSNGAMQFGAFGRVTFPISVFNTIRQGNDFSFAFWIRKEPSEITGNRPDFYPSDSDLWHEILWAKSDHVGADLGLSLHRSDSRGLGSGHLAFSKRTEINGKDFHWKQWMEEPTRLSWKTNANNELSPWTFVVVTFTDQKTSIYLYNEKMFQVGPVAERVALRRYTFMKLPASRLQAITSWGIGTLGASQDIAIDAMDDFTVFNTALTEKQIRDLMNAQIVGNVYNLASTDGHVE